MKKEDLRKAFIEAAKPKPFTYNVEAWGGFEATLMPMDPEGLIDVADTSMDKDVMLISIIIGTAVEHMVDEDGDPLFDYDDEADRKIIHSRDAAGYREIFDVLQDRATRKSDRMEGNLRAGKERQRKRRR